MFISIVFTIIFILFISNLGELINIKFDLKITKLISSYLLGFIVFFAEQFALSIPFLLFNLNYNLYLILNIIIIIMLLLLFWKYKTYKKNKLISLPLIPLLAIFLLIYLFIDINIGGDIQYYVGSVAQNKINSMGIYNFEPWSGAQPYQKWIWYKLIPFELIQALISSLSFNSTFLTVLWTFPLIFVYTFLDVLLCLIKELTDHINKNISYLYLILLGIIIFFTGYSNNQFHPYTLEYFFLLPFSGIAYLLYLFVPLFFLISLKFFSFELEYKKISLLLIVLGFMGFSFSSTNLFLFTFLLITIFFVSIIFIKDSIQRIYAIKSIYLSFFPIFIYLILTFIANNNYILAFLILILAVIWGVIFFYLNHVIIIFKNRKINLIYFCLFTLGIYSVSILVRKYAYSDMLAYRDFINNISEFFKDYNFLIVIFIICIFAIILDQSLELRKKIFYVYFNIFYIIMFVNPISAISISKFITSEEVYCRLLFGINIVYIFIYLFELFRKKERENILGLSIIGVILFYMLSNFRMPISEFYFKTSDIRNYNFIYKMENEKVELFDYLSNREQMKIVVPESLYRKGLRGVAPNIELFVTVYDDRFKSENNNMYVADKATILAGLNNDIKNSKEYIRLLKKYDIEYIICEYENIEYNVKFYKLEYKDDYYMMLKVK